MGENGVDVYAGSTALSRAPPPLPRAPIYRPQFTFVANDDLTNGGKADVPVDVYDYHNYWSFDTMVANQYLWDAYNRSLPRVFNSEYATKPAGRGNLLAALGDAVWLTGLERNSDVVVMAAYAPLLMSTSDVAWTPNAIVFNATAAYGIPSYWVQVLFRSHTAPGSHLLPYNATAGAGAAAAGAVGGDLRARFGVPIVNAVANASFSVTADADGAIVVKAVNYGAAPRYLGLHVRGGQQAPAGTLFTITAPTLGAENSLERPEAVAPVSARVATGPGDVVALLPWSVNVLRLDVAPVDVITNTGERDSEFRRRVQS